MVKTKKHHWNYINTLIKYYCTLNDSKSLNNSTSIIEDNISNFVEHLFSSAITSKLETPKKKNVLLKKKKMILYLYYNIFTSTFLKNLS